MRKIRKGKDIVVRWSLYRNENGERVPFAIDATAVLKVQTPYGTITATEVTIEGNVVSWTFRGKDQEHLGYYGLELVQNDGEKGMVTVDTCTAFALVAHSCEETPDVGGDVVTDAVMLEGEVAFAPLVIELGGESYDDTELRDAIADLQEKDKATDTQLAEQSAKLTELSAEVSEVSEAVGKKADEQGYYPNLSVGMADNLLGHAPAVEREIVFDATASKDNDVTEDVARIEAIKGNSVVWNQLFNKGVNTNGEVWDNNLITINVETTTAYDKYDNNADAKRGLISHKYLQEVVKVSGTVSQGLIKWCSYAFGGFVAIDSNTPNGVIMQKIGSIIYDNAYWSYRHYETNTIVNGLKIRHVVYDLTQMFGAGNEPTTIDEFYSRIPSGVDINAYNEGEVIHNYATGLKSVGFNAWDEQCENGALKGDGSLEALGTRLTTSFIEVLPNATYHQSGPSSSYNGRYLIYDADKNVIFAELNNGVTLASKEFTTPQNAKYVRITFGTSYGTTYKNDICIHLAHTGYRNGEYAPYWEESIGLPNTLVFADGMKSAGSARDEVYYDRYAKKWRVIKRIGVVDMGSLVWGKSSASDTAFYTQSLQGIAKAEGQLLSVKFVLGSLSGGASNVARFDTTSTLYASLAPYTDANEFKASLQGVMFYYELAEPIESDLDDYLPATMSAEERAKVHQFIYRVSDFGTEQMLTDEGVKSSALVADIVYGVDAFRTLVNLRKRVAALEK